MDRMLLPFLVTTVLLFGPSLPATGQSSNGDYSRIVGGTPASPDEFPWQIGMAYQGRFFCGGSLIAPQWVLTAAHCVVDDQGQLRPVGNWTIYAGSTRQMDGESRRLRRIIVHEHYNRPSQFANDIALLELDRALSLPRLDLATEGSVRAWRDAAEDAVVVGWGTTREGGNTSDRLLKAWLPVMDWDTCRAVLERSSPGAAQFVNDRNLCAGLPQGGVDTCQGDSGGPMVMRGSGGYQQVGIVSWGNGCARPGTPGVYTHVARYVPWISGHARDVGSSPGTSPAPPSTGTGGRALRLAVAPADRVRLGDRVQFQIATQRTGYLTVVDVNAAGVASQIFPNPYSGGGNSPVSVSAGRTVTIPDASYGFDFVAQEPVGQGLLFAILTDRPVPLEQLVGQISSTSRGFVAQQAKASMAPDVRRLGQRLLDRLGQSLGPMDGTWTAAALTYEIGR